MTTTTTTTTAQPTVTIDVYTDGPQALRRRLRDERVASLLPGGLLLEDTAEAFTYRLATPEGWSLVAEDGGFRLESGDGVTLVLKDGSLQLSLAK